MLLKAAGWHVCDAAAANIHATRGVAIREFPLKSGHGFADYLLYVDGKAVEVNMAKKEGVTLAASKFSPTITPRASPQDCRTVANNCCLTTIHRNQNMLHQRPRISNDTNQPSKD